LNVLKHKCHQVFDSIEGTPGHEYPNADAGEYAVAPKRIGNNCRATEPFLSVDPDREQRNESETKDEACNGARRVKVRCVAGQNTMQKK